MSEIVGPARLSPRVVPGRRWLALAVLCVAELMLTLDNTLLNVALLTLVRALGAGSGQLQWTVDAHALVFAGLMMVGGSLGTGSAASGCS